MADRPDTHATVDSRLAGCRLTIDLGALAANYRALAKLCQPAETAGVVKADAYGLGIAQVAPALAAAGCRTFFVALPQEGVAVRKVAPEARIFVLNGLFGSEVLPVYVGHRLIPVLNSPADVALWEQAGHGNPVPCAINIDTGMNRLGMTPADARSVAEESALTRTLHIMLVMSHLACADDRANPMNLRQAEAFAAAAAPFGDVPRSLVNSAGVFHGHSRHMTLTRPGIAVYGGTPIGGIKNPMRPVVTAEARVAQVRHARAGETVSYGASATLHRDTVIAVAAAGYADGLHRTASGSGVPIRAARPHGGFGFVAGRRVPILGRVTMDLTMFDVTDCGPDAVGRGDWIELFGPNIPLDEAAEDWGTISYEVLTSLGRRYRREYVGGVPASG